jgi:cell division topological specificity factor
MPEFLDRLLGRASAKKSGTMAKERLQFILVHDRINLPPERMEAMKKEILEVIAKYVSVDNENVDIALQKRERASLLVAEIPFLKTLEAIEYEDDDDKPEDAAPMMADDPVEKPLAGSKPQPESTSAAAPAPAPEPPAVEDIAKPAPAKPAPTPKRKR